MARLACIALAWFALACGGEESGRQLRVDLVTDFVPGTEFDAVRVSIGEGDIREEFSHIADPDRNYVRGVALGDIPVPESEQAIEVSLFQDGDLVIARRVSVIVQTPITIATVVITRDCRGITCPGAGESPLLASCLGGQCADPRCTVETPEFCPDGSCFVDSDCTLHPCASARCVTNACLYETNDANCEDGERCDIEMGCVRAEFDAGPRDAGPRDSGQDGGPDARMTMPDGATPDTPMSMPDAGPDIPDVPVVDVFDAGPPPGCPSADGNTLFLYDFQTPRDAVSAIMGNLVDGAALEAGDSPCGGRMVAMNGPLVSRFAVPDRAPFHLDEGSIDFWVKRPAVVETDSVGIVSRDAVGVDVPGHMTLFFTQDERLALRAQLSDVDEVVLCADSLPQNRWVRIGINFGAAGLELYVDGVRQMAGGTVNIFASVLTPCSAATIPFSIAGNDNPFVIGASSQESLNSVDTPPSYGGTGWHFDHFRLSRVRRNYAAEL